MAQNYKNIAVYDIICFRIGRNEKKILEASKYLGNSDYSQEKLNEEMPTGKAMQILYSTINLIK